MCAWSTRCARGGGGVMGCVCRQPTILRLYESKYYHEFYHTSQNKNPAAYSRTSTPISVENCARGVALRVIKSANPRQWSTRRWAGWQFWNPISDEPLAVLYDVVEHSAVGGLAYSGTPSLTNPWQYSTTWSTRRWAGWHILEPHL